MRESDAVFLDLRGSDREIRREQPSLINVIPARVSLAIALAIATGWLLLLADTPSIDAGQMREVYAMRALIEGEGLASIIERFGLSALAVASVSVGVGELLGILSFDPASGYLLLRWISVAIVVVSFQRCVAHRHGHSTEESTGGLFLFAGGIGAPVVILLGVGQGVAVGLALWILNQMTRVTREDERGLSDTVMIALAPFGIVLLGNGAALVLLLFLGAAALIGHQSALLRLSQAVAVTTSALLGAITVHFLPGYFPRVETAPMVTLAWPFALYPVLWLVLHYVIPVILAGLEASADERALLLILIGSVAALIIEPSGIVLAVLISVFVMVGAVNVRWFYDDAMPRQGRGARINVVLFLLALTLLPLVMWVWPQTASASIVTARTAITLCLVGWMLAVPVISLLWERWSRDLLWLFLITLAWTASALFMFIQRPNAAELIESKSVEALVDSSEFCRGGTAGPQVGVLPGPRPGAMYFEGAGAVAVTQAQLRGELAENTTLFLSEAALDIVEEATQTILLGSVRNVDDDGRLFAVIGSPGPTTRARCGNP